MTFQYRERCPFQVVVAEGHGSLEQTLKLEDIVGKGHVRRHIRILNHLREFLEADFAIPI